MQGNPSRLDQQQLVKKTGREQGDPEAEPEKLKGGTRGRGGRGRGGRGKGARGGGRGGGKSTGPGRGRGRGKKAEVLQTPKAKASKTKRMPASSSFEELETPAKQSPPERRVSGKQKPAAPVQEASPAKQKRTRHSEEEKSFARRARPKGEDACAQWRAIRDTFNDRISSAVAGDVPSKHQDLMQLKQTCFLVGYSLS